MRVFRACRSSGSDGRTLNDDARHGRAAADCSGDLVMFRTHRIGATLILSLRGYLTGRGTVRWLDYLSTARPLPLRVIVDLAAVTGVDRRGAEALVDAYIATTLRSGCLALTRPTILVSRRLDAFGVSHLVPTLPRTQALWMAAER